MYCLKLVNSKNYFNLKKYLSSIQNVDESNRVLEA